MFTELGKQDLPPESFILEVWFLIRMGFSLTWSFPSVDREQVAGVWKLVCSLLGRYFCVLNKYFRVCVCVCVSDAFCNLKHHPLIKMLAVWRRQSYFIKMLIVWRKWQLISRLWLAKLVHFYHLIVTTTCSIFLNCAVEAAHVLWGVEK